MRCAMQAMIEGLQEDAQRLEGPLTVRAAYAGDLEAGQRWRDALQQVFPNCTVGLDHLPLSVCCHVGWGALGVGIARDNTVEAKKP